MTLQAVLFYLLAAVSIASAIMVITRRNPVTSALFLVLNFFSLGGLYLTLHAQFIAVIQILVYAGAIMVLFLFVIMLLNLGDSQSLREVISLRKLAGVGLSTAFLLEIIYILGFRVSDFPAGEVTRGLEIGTVEYIGQKLFTDYLFPFEITSILLLAAIVGAVVMAKRKLD